MIICHRIGWVTFFEPGISTNKTGQHAVCVKYIVAESLITSRVSKLDFCVNSLIFL